MRLKGAKQKSRKKSRYRRMAMGRKKQWEKGTKRKEAIERKTKTKVQAETIELTSENEGAHEANGASARGRKSERKRIIERASKSVGDKKQAQKQHREEQKKAEKNKKIPGKHT